MVLDVYNRPPFASGIDLHPPAIVANAAKRDQRDKGVAVLIVSAELDEIYALADRAAARPGRPAMPA